MTARTPLLRPGLLALAGLAALGIACSGSAPSTAEATPVATESPASTSTAVAGATAHAAATPATVDVNRVLTHLRALSVDIGTRTAGSEPERRAAQYIAGVLTADGYTTAIETFTFPDLYDESSVGLGADGGSAPQVAARLLEGSAIATVSGVLVDGGSGLPGEIETANVAGRVVLVRRGSIPFAQKVANALQGGAIAVLVVNNDTGPIRGGTLGQVTTIPALGLPGSQSAALRNVLGQTVRVVAAGGRAP